ncbi:MAG: CBS domain-containing protein [Pseudomonadota bacterium]
MKVADILHAKGPAVITVRRDETVLDLSERLRKERIGAAIVSMDGETIDGIVSERDVAYAVAAHASRLPTVLVETIMTRVVVVCSPDDTVNEVMSVMTKQRFRHLPVQDGQKLVGIISIGDVMKHRLSEVQLEADVLRDYARVQR